MKVLYLPFLVGDMPKFTHGLCRAFKEDTSLEVEIFDWNAEYHPKSQLFAKSFMSKVSTFSPDWIHVEVPDWGPHFNSLLSAAKKVLRPKKVKVSAWSFEARDNVNRYLAVLGKVCDVTFVCHTGQAQDFLKIGSSNVVYLPDGIDEQIYRPVQVSDEDLSKHKSDIVFIGSEFSHRMRFSNGDFRSNLVKKFSAEFGESFKVYGNEWKGIKAAEGYLGFDANTIYNCSKISLGINNLRGLDGYFSNRQVRAMGSGTMHLCEYTPGLENLFKNRVHCVWFRTQEEATALAKYYLEHDLERRSIAFAGAKEILKNHTYSSRLSYMKKVISELCLAA